MNLGLSHLIDPRLLPLVEETSAFYAHRPAGQGPGNPEELRAVRARLANPAAANPPAVEEVASADGRSVPVRVHEPEGTPRSAGVLLPSDVDGRTLRDVHLDDGLGTEEGDLPPAPVHPTLLTDKVADPQVAYLPGDRTWPLAPAVSILAVGIFAVLAWRVHRWAREKRTARRLGEPVDGPAL